MSQQIKHKVAIVGGGAAGLFAGCFLKRAGADFVVLEKNSECGKKLLLTGHGRCNITNLKPPRDLKKGFHEEGNFVYPAISGFAPSDCFKFFTEELGVSLKIEENDRVFPKSDKAADIRDSMIRFIGSEHLVTGFDVTSIKKVSDGFALRSSEGKEIIADKVILSCGGSSYPGTGSDGSGHKLAFSLGHRITDIRASLAAVPTDPEFCSELSGVTLANVSLALYYDGSKKASSKGNLLFTHNGISGPSVMTISREIPAKIKGETYFLADLAPDLTASKIADEVNANPNSKFVNILSKYVPKSLALQVVQDKDILCHELSANARKNSVRSIKEHRFCITKTPDVKTAYCTRGGVSTDEVDRKTYESSVANGLYIVGELLDVDGISGGYNLAFAAGSSAMAVRDILNKIS